MPLSRRTLLLSAGAVGCAGVAGAVAIAPSVDPEGAVAALVRRCVPDLDMPATEIRAFAADYLARNPLAFPKGSAHLFLMAHDVPGGAVSDRVEAGRRRIQEEVITAFMLSTDHLDPARGDAPTTYFGPADPYEAGCANPIPGWYATT